MTILYQDSACPHRSPAARIVRKVLVACAAGDKGETLLRLSASITSGSRCVKS